MVDLRYYLSHTPIHLRLGSRIMIKIRARHKGTKNIYVHNDLSNAAHHFKQVIEAKTAADDRKDIAFDYLACMMMLAFASEAMINFIGQKLIEPWDERQPTKDKFKSILKHLHLERDWNKRPYSSIVILKDFRHLIAHGKPVNLDFDEEIVKPADDMDRPEILDSEWVKYCSHDQVFDAYDDVDAIWHELLAAAGIPKFETITSGFSSLSFIESISDD